MAKKSVALFGGAFDPVHLDHVAMGRLVLDLQLAEEVWYMPSPDRWDKRLFASATHRLAMLHLVLDHDPRFVISDLEIQNGEFRGTYHLLNQLTKAYPECSFHLMIGADSYASIPKWRDPQNFYGTEFNGEALLKEYSLILFARHQSDVPKALDHKKCGYPPFSCVGPAEGFSGVYSSSSIRDDLLHPQKIPAGLDPQVYQYIRDHSLYE